MADLLLVDFANRSRTYTKQELPVDATARTDAQVAAALASGLDTDPEVLAAFYESSLGYVAPESDPA